ncbi:transketolase [Agathobaculum sp.]|uniref:transketolase n=1 Tax=Agathobaculum sp. TaxID=2048138 RepID=UPI002A8163AA|nr:transketolase [Agathobaculum sp.]MDY3618709.1 transketolase [Agathobaculum sp.]
MKTTKELQIFAAQIRMTALRGLSKLGAGHIGGSMSMADLMAVLYGGMMKIDPKNPAWPERDWLVVSKGHCGPALYAALALRGFFPEEEITTINQPGTRLPSHCDRNLTPGVDMSTGSLGQGMSTALGVSWGNRFQNKDSYTYLVLGDGESEEGQVWEGALWAHQQNLGNLIAFIDCNQKQLDGYTKDICDLGDIRQKFADFGWDAQSVDGHDVEAIIAAIESAKKITDKPHMIVLQTEKGKGCTFAEDVFYNHHMKFTGEQYEEAVGALQREIDRLQGKEA